MRKINILPLFEEYADELVAQQRELFAGKAIDSVAFSFTLVPEGTPPLDKATECVRRFRVFQEKLCPLGIPCGILLQATWGHGWTPDEPADFQRIVRLDGSTQYTMCPEDEGFRDYIFRAVVIAASARPDFMMLDDDTRFITARSACFCPLHTALYNKEYGTLFTPDGLREAVSRDEAVARRMDAVLQTSMQRFARLVRDAIDHADPRIPCSFCLCAEDVRHAPAVARILAGEGQPPVIRINNGRYLQDSLRTIPQWLYSTARQVAALTPDITVLCEPDTCPQNRHSTSASMLLAHLLLSAFEGCGGAKLWITRMAAFEPNSGTAYREALCRFAGMVDATLVMRPQWAGVRIPLPEEPPFNFPPRQVPDGWHGTLGRMGVPIHFGKGPALVTTLSGSQIDEFSDDELGEVFQGNVLLDGSAAETLDRRGLSDLCGCGALAWNLPHVSLETLADGTPMQAAGKYTHLRPLSAAAEITSTLWHRAYPFAESRTELAPGAVVVRSSVGGVITIANWLGGEWFEAFGMLNESRKAQLVTLLNRLSPLPVWYPDDAELLLKAGTLADGARVVVAVNLGLDCLSELPLRGSWLDPVPEIRRMQGDGSWRALELRRDGGGYVLATSLAPLEVAILRLSVISPR